jgi:ketosteroid isomerase-like protein
MEVAMKLLALTIPMTILPLSVGAQTRPDDLRTRIQLLEDRAALKNLVDTFSNLADVKDVDRQLLLFTEDATVESRTGDGPGTPMRGRQQIGNAFRPFLAGFETVYHTNGQQTVEIDGDTATGISYCLVVLISRDGANATKLTMGVRYADEYVRRDGVWLISKRVSNFMWRDTEPMSGTTR